MKSLLLIISMSAILGFNLFSQGNYVFEAEAFELIDKIATAKKYGIKTIHYYPNYISPQNKGECERKESYGLTGNLLEEIYFPGSKKEYLKNTFTYDNNGRIKEIYGYLLKKKEPFSVVHLDYYQSNQLKSMAEKIIKSDKVPDTILYYYTIVGRFDYKVWSHNRSVKAYIRYNKCNEIEYVAGPPYRTESIQLDDNDCVIFAEIEAGEDESYHKRINNNNCQNVSDYAVYQFRKEWNIYSTMREYDTNNRPIKIINKECRARSKATCENQLKITSIDEIEYNNNGLIIFLQIKNEKGRIKKNIYTEYEYY